MTGTHHTNGPTNINITVNAGARDGQASGGLSARAEATHKAACDMVRQTMPGQPMPRREDFAHITDDAPPPLAEATTLVPVDLEKDRPSVVAGRTYQEMVQASASYLGNRHIRAD